MRHYLNFARPFTLLAPMLGVISGALTAWGSRYNPGAGSAFGWDELSLIAIASLAAAVLNAASNGVNQICDLEIDRINKPGRPLVTGQISRKGAVIFTVICYLVSVAITYVIVPIPGLSWYGRLTAPLHQHECFFFYLIAAVFTLVYSVPAMGRTKRRTYGANITIAIPRGLMLKVAGWSVLAPVGHWEPWFIGLCFFLFLIGAASTKDFSDLKGDREGGCMTLPNRYGIRRAAWMIAPSFVVPWFLIPLGLFLRDGQGERLLSGDPLLLLIFAASLITWGSYTVYLILRNPQALSEVENHPSWKHMYLMMLWAQTGFALAYLISV